MTLDFTKINELTENSNDELDKNREDNLKNELLIEPKLQYKANQVKKKDDWYHKILEDNDKLHGKAQYIIEDITNMIEDNVQVEKLFAITFLQLMNMSTNPDYYNNKVEYLSNLATKDQNNTAKIVVYEYASQRLQSLYKLHNQKLNETLESRMRRENAIKLYEELLQRYASNNNMKEGEKIENNKS